MTARQFTRGMNEPRRFERMRVRWAGCHCGAASPFFVFVFEFTSGYSLSHGKIEREEERYDGQTDALAGPTPRFLHVAPPDKNEGSAELHGFSLLQFP
jgi:hypothetical protein